MKHAVQSRRDQPAFAEGSGGKLGRAGVGVAEVEAGSAAGAAAGVAGAAFEAAVVGFGAVNGSEASFDADAAGAGAAAFSFSLSVSAATAAGAGIGAGAANGLAAAITGFDGALPNAGNAG